MKTWVIILILVVVVFVIVPLVYFTVIVRNADKLIAPTVPVIDSAKQIRITERKF